MSEVSAEQTRLAQLWEEHMRHEFQTCSTEDTLATMVEDAYVNHVPVMTGGVGHAELRQFYATHFIPKMPPDMEMTPLSRTIGTDQLVDEMVVRFTHTVGMDWMLPGIAPTGKRVEVALRRADDLNCHPGGFMEKATPKPWVEFAPDSPLEEAGFELHQARRLFPAEHGDPMPIARRAETRFSASKNCPLSSLAHPYRARLGRPLR
jgi:hypothetical protein